MLRSSTTSYYEADGLGSVTSLSNAAGALAQTYTFDSFGKQTASSGSLTNPFQFTGREFDTESSLYFMRARYFDPTTGRFFRGSRTLPRRNQLLHLCRRQPGQSNRPIRVLPLAGAYSASEGASGASTLLLLQHPNRPIDWPRSGRRHQRRNGKGQSRSRKLGEK